ncbi:MAG: beta-lactamase family protein [Bryobacterales bacterium]|nr:beta-lactamase family protein [Bryobacterales bacterium]
MITRRTSIRTLGAAPLAWMAAHAARTGYRGRTQAIHDRIDALIAANEVPGAVTVIVTPGSVEHLHAQGFADAARTVPMKKDAVFAIASMSKPVTGAAIMMLRDEGKLRVEDPVAKYLPEFSKLKLTDGRPAQVTLKHLMTHTSGMGEATPQEAEKVTELPGMIPVYLSKPVAFEPGSQWKYCQSGINTLGRIVEVASGMPFADFLDKRLFQPLGMKNTSFYLSPKMAPKLVKACKRDGGKLVDANSPRLDPKYLARRDRPAFGNGGLLSTAEDYSRFARMLLSNGEWKGKRLLSADSVKQMTSPHTGDLKAGFVPGSVWGLTCGLVRESTGITALLSPGTYGHGGAFGTQAWMDPVKGVGLILMIQRTDLGNSDASVVRQAFQEAALG